LQKAGQSQNQSRGGSLRLSVRSRALVGTISNFEQIKKSLQKLADLKKKTAEGAYANRTKKERLLIDREINRLERFFGGMTALTKVPDVLVVVDTRKEAGAVREAKSLGLTVVGIVDSNADPEAVDYPVPMNDDAAKALEYVLDLIGEAISAGKK
jgi:small subunit ribosomal protein S2